MRKHCLGIGVGAIMIVAVASYVVSQEVRRGAAQASLPVVHRGGPIAHRGVAAARGAIAPLTGPPNWNFWTLTGALPPPLPVATTNAYPLSDQTNQGGWTLNPAMSDEFEGGTLDLTKWISGPLVCSVEQTPCVPASSVAGPWPGRQPGLVLPENVAVGKGPSGTGNLQIAIKEDPTNPAFTPALAAQGYNTWTTGLVHTLARGCYGYYECKAKIAAVNADCAFWFQQEDPTVYPGVETEIDIFELGGTANTKTPPYSQWDFMSVHVFEYPGKTTGWSTDWGKSCWWISNIAFRDAYHVYGLERNDNQLIWYVDGVQVQTVTNFTEHQPQWLTFDIETVPNWFGLPNAGECPATYNIEYVRSWTQGTPTPPPTPPPTPVTPVLTVVSNPTITIGSPITGLVISNAPGTFTYTPATAVALGTVNVTAVFTPTNSANYTGATASFTVTVVPVPSNAAKPQPRRISKNSVLPPEWGWKWPQPGGERREDGVALRRQVYQPDRRRALLL